MISIRGKKRQTKNSNVDGNRKYEFDINEAKYGK